MNKNLIFYIVSLVIILAITFFSQQSYTHDLFKNVSSNLNKFSGASLLGGLDFNSPSQLDSTSSADTNTNTDSNTDTSNDSYELIDSANNSAKTNILQNIDFSIVDKAKMAIPNISEIPQKVTDIIKSGGEVVENTINTTKENISAAEKKVVDYFSGISDAIQGKENNSSVNQCPPVQ